MTCEKSAHETFPKLLAFVQNNKSPNTVIHPEIDSDLLLPTGVTTSDIKTATTYYLLLTINLNDETQAADFESRMERLETVGEFAQRKLIEAKKETRHSDDETQTRHW